MSGPSAPPPSGPHRNHRRSDINIDKNQILQLLRSQGKDDPAGQAGSELPDKVDTDNAQHAGMLSKYSIDHSSLSGKLGGLGNAP